MADNIDQTLLRRLEALRAPSTTPARPPQVSAAAMTRTKSTTRKETLADRLKRLRHRNAAFHPPCPTQSTTPAVKRPSAPGRDLSSKADSQAPSEAPACALKMLDDAEAGALFQADDHTLGELLRRVDDGAPQPWFEPREDEVTALLNELSLDIPRNDETRCEETQRDAHQVDDCDDSNGEWTTHEANKIPAQSQHGPHLEASVRTRQQPPEVIPWNEVDAHAKTQAEDAVASALALDLPTLPAELAALPSVPDSTSSSVCDADIGSRLAALRTPLILPTVPTAQPCGTAAARFSSRTKYTDDVESWCTVCLDDATLRCLGCDNDPYCSRCWAEMHLGSAAAFDDRTHKSVQFSRKRPKDKAKVTLGAA